MRTLLLFAFMMQSAVAATTWQGVTEYPATTMPGEGLSLFARLLSERSGGALTMTPRFDAPDGLRSATIPGAVEAGRIEVGDAFAGTLSALDPLFQLSSLPFLATGTDDAWRLYQAARPDYRRIFAAHGQRLLYATPWPATGLWTKVPVTSAGSMIGLAVRTYDGTSTQVFRAVGAAPVQLSFADALPRLADGSVAAVLSSGDGGAGRNLWDYTRQFCTIGYAAPLSFATVSTAAYDALTPELRAVVDATASDTEAAQWQALIRRGAENETALRMNGVVITAPPADLVAVLAEAGSTVTEAWLTTAGPEAAAILDAYRR